MADYLQRVGGAWRIASIVGCTFTAVISLLIAFLFGTDMIRRRSFDYDGKPLWIGAVVLVVIGMASVFISWRLVCQHTAANGVTVMPTWFIQLFGILLLAGLCCFAYFRGNLVFLIEGVLICLAMILVGRNIAKKRGRKA